VSLTKANPEDAAVHVLLNGEIWNFSELKAEIGRPVGSEIELVREGYLRHGIDYVARLDGMFCLAILDRTQRRLYFARDPVGIKPAFFAYSEFEGRLTFASDIKPLVNDPSFDARINQNYLINTATVGYSDYDDCLIGGIRQLAPGHYLQADLGTRGVVDCQLARFDLRTTEDFGNEYDQLDAQLHLLERAIAKRARHKDSSQIGLLLSGGIDSSLMAFIAGRLGLEGIVCFHLGPPGTEDHKWAKWVAAQAGYPLEHIQPHPADVLKNLPRYCYQLSGQQGYVAPVFAEAIRRSHPDMKIVLCGEGSDELYGGYHWYADSVQTVNRVLRRLTHVEGSTALIDAFRSRFEGDLTAASATEALIEFCLGPQLVNNHLLPLDHGFMAHGIELRVPFLDLENVRFARRISISRKVHEGRTKVILKALITRCFSVPDDFVWRRKVGFPASIPPAILDVDALARALIPVRWRENHPYRGWLRSAFDMMWFDLACLVLPHGNREFCEAIRTIDLYSEANKELIQSFLEHPRARIGASHITGSEGAVRPRERSSRATQPERATFSDHA
jgi:asparagine synthase (glutamine-hydrolysing)